MLSKYNFYASRLSLILVFMSFLICLTISSSAQEITNISSLNSNKKIINENKDNNKAKKEADKKDNSNNKIIIHWEEDINKKQRNNIKNDNDIEVIKNLGNKDFQLIEAEDNIDQTIKELEKENTIKSVDKEGYSKLDSTNDPYFNNLWALDNKGLNINGSESIFGKDMRALLAWNLTTGNSSNIIAIIDDGYRKTHPDLTATIWNNPNETLNGIDDNGNGIIDDVHGADLIGNDMDSPSIDGDPTDEEIYDSGHGTHVAGIAGAKGNNGLGITGVNQNASIMPLRVCSYSTIFDSIGCPHSAQIAAINYAGANGAKVANMSLGGSSNLDTVRDALAQNPNTLYIISAGNNGTNNDSGALNAAKYPCNYDPSTSGIPGAIDNVLCVAASDQRDIKASFSNWGKTSVDVAAPGTEILSSYTTRNYFNETFENNNLDNFVNDGFSLVNSSPLTSNGVTNNTATQLDNTTRTLTTNPINLPSNSYCSLGYFRKITINNNDEFNYQFLINNSVVETIYPDSDDAGYYGADIELPSENPNLAVKFNYHKEAGSADTNGVWIDNISLDCYISPGNEDNSSYAYLNGTSMAAPQVTGIASLLWSFEPSASVTNVKNAIINSVDPISMFNPSTGTYPLKSGGRVNAYKALNKLGEYILPNTIITSNNTNLNNASFNFQKTESNAPVSFECSLNNASFTACNSGISYNNLQNGNHNFRVRAKNHANQVDLTPASYNFSINVNKTIVNTSLPTIQGDITEGKQLTATDGAWNGLLPISYSYQWMSCSSNGNSCSNITSANSNVYLLKASDANRILKVKVTAINIFANTNALSRATDKIKSKATTIPNPNNPTTLIKINKEKIIKKAVQKGKKVVIDYYVEFISDKKIKANLQIISLKNGRKVNNKCVKISSKNNKKKVCKLNKSVSKSPINIKKDKNSFKLEKLAKGNYTIKILIDNKKQKSINFKVL